MLPASFLAIIFTLGLSVFLNTSFHSFKDYNHQVKDLTNWQETGLAAAKRVSLESSELLFNIQTQLNTCLEDYSALKDQNQRDSFKCEAKFREAVTDFKNSLKANYTNQLNNTIKFGLNPDSPDKVYETYDYALYHSDRLPSAFKKGDDLYNSTIASQSDLDSLVKLNDFEYLLDGHKLNIDYGLLKTLVGKESADLISNNPAQFDLSTSSNKKLKESKLPNAIKIAVKFYKRQSQGSDESETNSSLRGETEAISKKEILSAAQLRLLTSSVPTGPTVTCNVCDCPGYPACPTSNPGGGTSSPVTTVNRQTITFSLFDNINGRGILFDNTRPASAQNKINIVNTQQGRFTSVYPGSGNYLQIDIGTIPRGSSVLTSSVNNARNSSIDPKSVSFGSVTFQDTSVPQGHTERIGSHQQINVDIVPRARKRYMTAQRDFVVNGKTIPRGSVLVGTLEPGSSQSSPQLKDFSTIRVYNQDTGALMQIFKPGQRPNYCSGQACMNIGQFRGSASNSLGGTVHTSFSTSQLFAGKDAFTANALFTKIQRDLEVNTVTGIYTRNHNWQEVILSEDLNPEQQVLLTDIFNSHDLNNRSGLISLARDLGLPFGTSDDSLHNLIQTEMAVKFAQFAMEKYDYFFNSINLSKQAKNKKKNGFLKLKDEFLRNRQITQDLLKSKITRRQAIIKFERLNNINVNDDEYLADSNSTTSNNGNSSGSSNSGNTSINTKPPAPIAPNCISKKPKNRSNKCKNKIKKYKAALKKYNKKYG